MTGFQNENDMHIALILIKETSNLKWFISLIVGTRRCGGVVGCKSLAGTISCHRLIDV